MVSDVSVNKQLYSFMLKLNRLNRSESRLGNVMLLPVVLDPIEIMKTLSSAKKQANVTYMRMVCLHVVLCPLVTFTSTHFHRWVTFYRHSSRM